MNPRVKVMLEPGTNPERGLGQPDSRFEIGPPPIAGWQQTQQKLGTQPIGGAGGAEPPLWLVQVDDDDVIVRSGQIAGITPTNVATNITLSGTDGTHTVYAQCTVDDDGLVSAVTITHGTSGLPSHTSGYAYLQIGTVVVASGAITTVTPQAVGSFGFVACGRDTADPSTTRGTYYFFNGTSETGSGGGGGPPPP